jgi:hypothetical protein
MSWINKVDEEKRLKYASIIGPIICLILFGSWAYCLYSGRSTPNEVTNRIYEVNFHGTILYVNGLAYYSLWGIPVAALVAGIVSAIVIKYRRSRKG